MSTIATILGRNNLRDNKEFGIEVEVEGRGLSLENMEISDYWRHENDGSLRGDETREFVLHDPVSRDDLYPALEMLQSELTFVGAVVDESERTSVHVHINFLAKTVANVITTSILYYMVEQELFSYCGEFRKNNFYCLPLNKAALPLFFLEGIARDPDSIRSDTGLNDLRYSALNFSALRKYGTLEFRSLRGTVDKDVIFNWVRMLASLKDAACSYDNAMDLLNDWNSLSLPEFCDKNFQGVMSCFTEGWEVRMIESASSVMHLLDLLNEPINNWTNIDVPELELEFLQDEL